MYGKNCAQVTRFTYFLAISCHQAILRLPDASEASHLAYYTPSAASLHAGRAQAQALELLAEHQQADTLPEIRTAPCLCLNPFWESTLSISPRRWSPGSSNPLFTEDGTCAPAFSIYFADQLTWLRGETLRVCLHMCICASSQPCTAPATNFQEEITEWNLMCFIWKDFACQLYTASLLSAVNTTAAWQQSERGWQLLNLLAPCPLTCSEQQLSVADIHFPGRKNPSRSLPIPHSPPFWSRTWSSYTLLTNSVSLCWHSDKTTVSITLWPFSLSFNSTTLMNNIVH